MKRRYIAIIAILGMIAVILTGHNRFMLDTAYKYRDTVLTIDEKEKERNK